MDFNLLEYLITQKTDDEFFFVQTIQHLGMDPHLDLQEMNGPTLQAIYDFL